MSDSQKENAREGTENEAGTVRSQITPDPETAEYDLLEIIADVEGCQIEDLPSLYNEVEHVVETLFKTPPSTAAQMSLSFSYIGYRVTLDRRGNVKLVRVADTMPS